MKSVNYSKLIFDKINSMKPDEPEEVTLIKISNDDKVGSLINLLYCIKESAKDIHYNYCNGPDFYSIHILMDRICENLDDYIDEIKEKYYMSLGMEVPSPINTYSQVLNLLPEKSNLNILKCFINDGIELVKTLIGNCPGFDDLLGKIASDLLTKVALVNKSIRRGE